MLAVSGRPFNSAGWIFEPKIDGARCLAKVSSSGVRLHDRRLFDITYRYPELARSLAQPSGCVLDGEIAVFPSPMHRQRRKQDGSSPNRWRRSLPWRSLRTATFAHRRWQRAAWVHNGPTQLKNPHCKNRT